MRTKHTWVTVAVGATALASTGVNGLSPALGTVEGTQFVVRTHVVSPSGQCKDPGRDRDVESLGPIRVSRGRVGVTLDTVTTALGPPAQTRSRSDSEAIALWRGAAAARLTFVTYGGVTDIGQLPLQIAEFTGPTWVTDRGLHVGSTLRAVKRLYGKEAWQLKRSRSPGWSGDWWRLAGRCSVYTRTSDAPVVTVKIKRSKVSAIRVWVGGAGE